MGRGNQLDAELEASKKLYKIAGIAIVVLILIGILFVLLTKEKQPEQMAAPKAPEAMQAPVIQEPEVTQAPEITQIPEVTAPVENITVQNVTNASIEATPTVAPNASAKKLSWDNLQINFPDTLKKVLAGKNSYHHIEIIEGDGTPATNGEQFDISVTTIDPFRKAVDVIPTYEYNKWLILLLLPNKGNYTLTVEIKCERTGHCQKFYTGSVQKSSDFEVV